MITKCKACGQEIEFLPHSKTRNAAPIEIAVSDDGNIIVETDLLGGKQYRILPAHSRADFAGTLHLNHFSSCPQAHQFGRKAGSNGK